MNRKNNIFRIVALTSVLTLNASLFIALNKETQKVNAYSVSSLPTTIDLNDCSEQVVRSYYSNLNSLSVSERQGTNLLKNLKPILMNNQKYYKYDSGDKIWQIYEISDRDWAKSPASSTTYGTYNANTNKITNYQYGTSSSNSKNNPYIHALYINRNIENQTTAWDDHNQDAWGINREHIWAKSHGFDDDKNSAAGARGDPMHLWAGNGWANHEHSNYFFGFVDKTRSYSDAGSKYNTVRNNLTGYSKNAGGSEKVFEPQDCDKGDIARSIFYMVARYNNYAGTANDIDADNPNLVLLNNLSENSRTGTSGANDPYGMGLLSDLLAWNKLDPVDEYEIHRNNLLYKNYTNNRNPFIDFPNWADAIWGTANLDGKNYNPAITTSASPSTDPINVIDSNAFGISSYNMNLDVNDTATIFATNANGSISWSIADNTVVSLNKASTSNNEVVTITALKAGTTTITATSGGDSASCTITVGEAINYGTIDDPLTVDEAIEVVNKTGESETAQPLYVKGIVSYNAAYSTKYSNYDYGWLQNNDGSVDRAFQLYRFVLDEDVEGDYSALNSMLGKEVVAYGYGTIYDGKRELTTSSKSPNNPIIYKINNPEPTGIELDQHTANIEFDNTLSLTASLIPNNAVATIVWESSDESIATVSNGVITGVGNGEVIITARVDGYDLDAECVVTVSGAPFTPEDYLSEASSYLKLRGDEESDEKITTVTKTIVQILGTPVNATQYTSLTLDSTITVSVNSDGNNGKYYDNGKNWRLYQSNNAVVTVSASGGATISSITFVFTVANTGILKYGNTTVTSGAPVSISNSSSAQFSVANSGSATNGQVLVTSISVAYSKVTTTVSPAYLTFGATIPVNTWTTIDETWDITDYGVMIFRTTQEHLSDITTVKNYFESSPSNVTIVNNGNDNIDDPVNGNYEFYINVKITSVARFDTYYIAAPFIVAGGEYYFLTERSGTVRSLAAFYQTHDGCDLSDEALEYLVSAN